MLSCFTHIYGTRGQLMVSFETAMSRHKTKRISLIIVFPRSAAYIFRTRIFFVERPNLIIEGALVPYTAYIYD